MKAIDMQLPNRSAHLAAQLCSVTEGPTIERTDIPSKLDIHQEVMLRVSEVARTHGPLSHRSCESLIHAYPGVAVRSLQFARVEFFRNRYGRGQASRQFEAVDNDHPEDTDEFDLRMGAISARHDLHNLTKVGMPGIDASVGQEVVELMRSVQRLTVQGKPVPAKVRKQLSRMRARSGLALDISLL